jgi:hypothetical protein
VGTASCRSITLLSGVEKKVYRIGTTSLGGIFWSEPRKVQFKFFIITIRSARSHEIAGGLADIQDRMPATLKCEDYDRWLDPGFRQVKDLGDLLEPHPVDGMRRHPVSTWVHSVKNDDPSCAEEYIPQLLFLSGAGRVNESRGTGPRRR